MVGDSKQNQSFEVSVRFPGVARDPCGMVLVLISSSSSSRTAQRSFQCYLQPEDSSSRDNLKAAA